MKDYLTLNKIKEDLAFCINYWTVIYGSYLTRNYIPNRSDIDIAIITKIRDKEKNILIWKEMLGKVPSSYDLRIFELFPLYIKMDIIENHKTIFGDPLSISEYFYFYRKIWKDMIPRIRNNQFKSINEKLKLMENRKTLLYSKSG